MKKLYSILFVITVLVLTAFVPVAHALPLSPIPSPIAAGWIQEGSESYTAGLPLVITDADAVPNPASPLPFCNLYAFGTDADFAGSIRVDANLVVDAGFVPDGNYSTGVHVTINDGFRQIRAALLQSRFAGLHLAVETQVGFSPGIDLRAMSSNFSVTRLANGDAVIEARGQRETIQAVDLPGSMRQGVKTIEFGTYDTSAASVSRWSALDVRAVAVPEPSTLLLLGSGLSGFAMTRIRKVRKKG